MLRISKAALFALAILASVPVVAQQRGTAGRDAFFRCKDPSGQTHYGDSMPPACFGRDTEVLNERGTVMRVIEGEKSRAERVLREAEEARARKIKEEAEQRDRMLIETYLTVADIERLRDQRLGLLVAQSKITEQNMINLRERQARLQGQIARFKPYSGNASSPPLPDHLAEEMVNTVNSMRVYEETLTNNRREQVDIKAAFDRDIRRFKELKGLK